MVQTVYAGITAHPSTGIPRYVTPCVSVVQFAVENGFTDSYTEKLGLTDNEGDINLESRSNDGDNWGGVSDNYWF